MVAAYDTDYPRHPYIITRIEEIDELTSGQGFEIMDENGKLLFTISRLLEENHGNIPYNGYPFNLKYISAHWLHKTKKPYTLWEFYLREYYEQVTLGLDPNTLSFLEWLEQQGGEAAALKALLDEEYQAQLSRQTYFRLTFPNGYQVLLPRSFIFDTEQIHEEFSKRPELAALSDLFQEVCPHNFCIDARQPETLDIYYPEIVTYDPIDRPTVPTNTTLTIDEPIPTKIQECIIVPEGEDHYFTLTTPQGFEIVGMTRRELGKSKYRIHNEDSMGAAILDDGSTIIVIADGIGGRMRGEIASAVGVSAAIKTEGNISKRCQEAFNQIAFLSLYMRLYDLDFSQYPNASLVIIHLKDDHFEVIEYGDCRYFAIDNNQLEVGTYPKYTCLEDLQKRHIVPDIPPTSNIHKIGNNTTIAITSDGLLNDISFEEFTALTQGRSLEQALEAIRIYVEALNSAELREWTFTNGNPTPFPTCQDNATGVLIRKTANKNSIVTPAQTQQTFWRRALALLSGD